MRKCIGFGATIVAVLCLGAGAWAVDEKDLPNCIKDAKVGEWVLVEMQGGMQQRQTVIKVTKKEVTVKFETIMKGKVINSIETKIPLETKQKPDEKKKGPKPKITKEKVKVKDQEIECFGIEIETKAGTSKSYISNDIPVMGLVKSEFKGKVMQKVVDYGTKEEKKEK